MSTNIGKIQSVEITQEMRKSYLDYAMSVIVARALPDVRDGLKPVHRRILYAMHQMGLSHNSRYTKSAKVVGETMGKYHPHGDMAIYDTLVRLAQDFSMRYPLIDGQGNFGSTDGDSAAAMRYCLTGDTLVLTNKGIIPIEKITDKKEAEINLEVINYQGKTVKANKFFDSGKHPTIKIVTRQGYELKGSFNHPILCWGLNDFGFPALQWKLLQTITTNDYVIINRNFSLFSKDNLNLNNFYPQDSSKYKDIKLPNKMNEDIAFLLGALVSEGSFHQKQIIFNNQDLEFYTKVKEIIKKQFPGVSLYERSIKGNCQELSLYHQKAVKFLENIGLENVKSEQKEIPFAVLYSKKEIIKQFLIALFEGDGSTTSHKDKRHQGKSIELNYNSKSLKLIKQLKVLLLNFGIVTNNPYRDDRNSCYKLIISGKENIQRFKEEIGFFSPRKKAILKQIDDINPERMSKTDWIPFLNDYLRTNYSGELVKKNNFDRYNKLEKNYPHLKQILKPQDVILIEWLLKKRFFFDQVKTIEKFSEKENVYSIRVADQSHSFIANGFVNHNTEVRLDKITQEMIADIDKGTVDFQDNFDGSLKEPVFLPARLPNLLLMGSEGIAVGMATKIPPHNLNEIIDAVVFMIEKGKIVSPNNNHLKEGKSKKDVFEIKKISLDEDQSEEALLTSFESNVSIDEDLMKFIKGPDFPTGATIYNKKDILQAYATGNGKILVRAKAEIEEAKGEKFRIVITEIPYQVNKANLVAKIAQLVKERKIDGVMDLRDESDRQGLRVVVELKKTAKPKTILNNLYKNTQMQTSYPVNMVTLVDGTPLTLNLKQILTEFIKHRQKVVTKRTIFEFEEAKHQAHILEGLKIAVDNIDAVIATIKKSKDALQAKVNLMNKFKLTEIQSEAILEMQLRRLAALERKKIEDDYKEVMKKIGYLIDLLRTPKKILEVIKKELLEIKAKYGDSRRTKVYAQALGEFNEEDLVPQENCLVTLTKGGYIKRLPVGTYRSQKRGGKGVSGMATKPEDEVSNLLGAQTHDSILFFTNQGRVFSIRVWELPECSRQSKGQALVNLINISQDEKIQSVLTFNTQANQNKNQSLLMVTKKGIVKKTKLKAFANIRTSGLIAIKLNKGDELCWIKLASQDDHVLLVSHQGKSIRFKEKDVRPTGRDTMGVRGIRLKKDDYVMGMEVFPPKLEKPKDKRKKVFRDVLIVMEHGLGKRTSLNEYRLQKRGGIGIRAAHVIPKTGEIVACRIINEKVVQIILTSKRAQVIKLPVKNVPRLGRDTQGVIFMRFNKPGDTVAAVTCLE